MQVKVKVTFYRNKSNFNKVLNDFFVFIHLIIILNTTFVFCLAF